MKELEATITVENVVVHPYLTHINALLHSLSASFKYYILLPLFQII